MKPAQDSADKTKLNQLFSELFKSFFWYALFLTFGLIIVYFPIESWAVLKSAPLGIVLRNLILAIIQNIVSGLLVYIFTYLFVAPFRKLLDAHIAQDLVDRIVEGVSILVAGKEVHKPSSDASVSSETLSKFLSDIVSRANEMGYKQMFNEQDLLQLKRAQLLSADEVGKLTRSMRKQ